MKGCRFPEYDRPMAKGKDVFVTGDEKDRLTGM